MTELERIRNEMSKYAKNNYKWDTLYAYTLIQKLLTVIEKQSGALKYFSNDVNYKHARIEKLVLLEPVLIYGTTISKNTLTEVENLLKEIK